MKQLRLPIFNSKIKYYSLRIVPPEPVFQKVIELKKLFEFAYGKQPLSASKPHIPLASFRMNAKHQDLLVQVFNGLAKRKSFTAKINGFDAQETSSTLCLKVTTDNALKTLLEETDALYQNTLKRKVKSFVLFDTPHITIATTKGRQMLNDSLHYFQENEYYQEIEVGHLTLVGRLKHRAWDWEHEIPLS